jgi:hypothetical protein
MEFFKNIQKSIYGPEFYQGLLAKPFLYSLKYFALFSLLMALVVTIYLSVSVLPKVNTFLEGVTPIILDYLPDELEIIIKDGVASTNVPEPYFLGMPFKPFENLEMSPDIRGYGIENLLVIDTRSDEATLEEFKAYKTLALLSRKTMMNYDEDQVVIRSLADIPNFKLDKGVISSFLAKIVPYLRFVKPFFVIFAFSGYFSFVFFGKMLYLLLVALLILIVVKVRKVDIGYKKAYQLGLHLFTAGILYEIIFELILKMSGIPFLFIGITLALAIANLKPAGVLTETLLSKAEQAPPPSSI